MILAAPELSLLKPLLDLAANEGFQRADVTLHTPDRKVRVTVAPGAILVEQELRHEYGKDTTFEMYQTVPGLAMAYRVPLSRITNQIVGD